MANDWNAYLPLAPWLIVLFWSLCLLGSALRPHSVDLARLATSTASLFGLAASVVTAVAWARLGDAEVAVVGSANLSLCRLDVVTVPMLVLVGFIGAVVVRFSVRYLDGDPRQAFFLRRLGWTLAACLVLVSAGDLVTLFAGWVATSFALHGLLLFYADRPRARIAARKKFLLARIGDVALGGAFLTLFFSLGSIRISELNAVIESSAPAHVEVVALLLAIAAALKSAQFPLHGWLADIMDTPTPVSALLHAGLINAGGVLLLRFAPVIAASPWTQAFLITIGALTAAFGASAMTLQPSVKGRLAMSTVGQMGFMVLQCGLGLFPLALLHILAHSLYKADAFLSSGSEALQRVDLGDGHLVRAQPLAVGVLAAFACWLGAALALDGAHLTSGPLVVVGALFALGAAHLWVQSLAQLSNVASAALGAGLATMVTVLYVALGYVAQSAFGAGLPTPPTFTMQTAAASGLALAAFVAVLVSPVWMRARRVSPRVRAAYVQIHNGFHINTRLNVALGLYRIGDER